MKAFNNKGEKGHERDKDDYCSYRRCWLYGDKLEVPREAKRKKGKAREWISEKVGTSFRRRHAERDISTNDVPFVGSVNDSVEEMYDNPMDLEPPTELEKIQDDAEGEEESSDHSFEL